MTSTARPGWWTVSTNGNVDPVEAWNPEGVPCAVGCDFGLVEVVDHGSIEPQPEIWVLHDTTSFPWSLDDANKTLRGLELVANVLRYYEMDPWGRDLQTVLEGIQKHRRALERWKKKREPEEAVETLAKQELPGS